jgi:Transglutaminase-like superfamily
MTDILKRVGAWRGLIAEMDGVIENIREKYETKHIQELILYVDNWNAKRRFFKKLAGLLRGSNDRETCKNVYNFVRLNVKYVKDDISNDTVKSAIATLFDGFGDCKSMTLLSGAILRELGIFYKIRFTAYDATKQVTHVYLIAFADGKDTIIDCVFYLFDSEVPFKYYEDYYVFGEQYANKTAKINGVETVKIELKKTSFYTA